MTSAAGLAMGGMHPVVAIYSTFLNRAFDQVIMDVALHKLPVTMVLDRAGVTGPDGASHNGVWDLSMLGIVPGHAGRGTARRGPAARGTRRGARRQGRAHRRSGSRRAMSAKTFRPSNGVGCRRARHAAAGLSDDVLLVAVGAFAAMALSAAERLRKQGIGVTVVDPRWVLPVPEVLGELAKAHKLVVTVEDNGVHGGIGSAVSAALRRSRDRRAVPRRRGAAGVPGARVAQRGAHRRRADRPAHRPPDHRLGGRAGLVGDRAETVDEPRSTSPECGA